ncbi:MAG: hypothetical protein DWP97_09970 [Calditrichaeota bacterium]|nr:MAG: hypothetical protein DWP97_09970 [Calditrichota bacterium]
MLHNLQMVESVSLGRINMNSKFSSIVTRFILLTLIVLLFSTSAMVQTSGGEYYRSLIIVDSLRPNAYFGLYRFSQMTDPGWDLFRQTVDWAMNYQDHTTARICIVSIEDYADLLNVEDAYAAYNFLIDSMNIDSANISFLNQDEIITADLSDIDLVFNPRLRVSTSNIYAQGIPFITTLYNNGDISGLGNANIGLLHLNRDTMYVKTSSHPLTSNYNVGQLVLTDSMWMDAIYASGRGIPLVTVDEGEYVPAAEISVDHVDIYNTDLGDTAHIAVKINPGPAAEIEGFDILLSYDPNALTVVSVTQGALLDSCGWEYFTYRTGEIGSCEPDSVPREFIRIVGVAETSIVPGSPLCNISSAGTMINIEFEVTTDLSYECVAVPVEFYWCDCGDNAVSISNGDTLLVSRDVYLNDYLNITQDTTFPTTFGTPDVCITDESIQRRIDYHSGFVNIICVEPIDDRGDINLNGLQNEIADALFFANYFIYGLEVFTVNQEQQINNSDVNADGFPLTLDDYIYLWRIIVGDALPYPSPPSASGVNDTVVFIQDTLNKTVSINYPHPDSIRGVYLIFEGDLRPWGWGEDSTDTPFNGYYTRVLLAVYPSQDTLLFSHDSLFYYTGEGSLIGAYAAYDGINPIPTSIEGAAPSCCSNRGNVDDDLSGEVNISDLVSLVEYQFGSGTTPSCTEQIDLNNDWTLDLSDIIFFVEFMFSYGPAPAPCL